MQMPSSRHTLLFQIQYFNKRYCNSYSLSKKANARYVYVFYFKGYLCWPLKLVAHNCRIIGISFYRNIPKLWVKMSCVTWALTRRWHFVKWSCFFWGGGDWDRPGSSGRWRRPRWRPTSGGTSWQRLPWTWRSPWRRSWSRQGPELNSSGISWKVLI